MQSKFGKQHTTAPVKHHPYAPPRLLILGGSVLQLPALIAAKMLGCRVITADGNPSAFTHTMTDEFWHIDLRDIPTLVAKSKSAHLDGVMTCGTDFSYAVACIAQACQLPGIPEKTATIANFKDKMRLVLQAHGIPVPKFLIYNTKKMRSSAHIVKKISETYEDGVPLIIKPVDNMGARGVMLVTRADQLEKAVLYAAQHSTSSTIIVEEFIAGRELSIDSLILNGKIISLGIADRNIVFSPYFVETGHTIPSIQDSDIQERACDVLAKVAHVSGIHTGFCKGDIIIRNNEIYIGEFAARLSGGYMSGWTIPYSQKLYHGHTPSELAVKLALGIAIPEPHTQRYARDSIFNTQRKVAERALLSIPGKLRSIQVADSLYKSKYYMSMFLSVEEGQELTLPTCNPQKAGGIIASSELHEDINYLASVLVSKVVFQIEPNEHANMFLFSRAASHKEFSPWRCYPYSELEETGRENIRALLAKNGKQWTALPIWVPPSMSQRKDLGTWTHNTISQLIELAVQEGTLYTVSNRADSTGGLLWSALLRGGWQGLQYLLQLIQECPCIIQTLLSY